MEATMRMIMIGDGFISRPSMVRSAEKAVAHRRKVAARCADAKSL